jgi:hypothetical protein
MNYGKTFVFVPYGLNIATGLRFNKPEYGVPESRGVLQEMETNA